jgi:trimeric autotransporter adhesin
MMFLLLGSTIASAQGSDANANADRSARAWQQLTTQPPAATSDGHQRAVHPRKFRAFSFNRGEVKSMVASAPGERTRAAREGRMVISLPAPGGGFQRFAVWESPIMEPGLAAKHPDIKTYAGRGLDDRTAYLRFDLSPLGFHASVRSAHGSWYIDPYYQKDESLYVSYYGRDLENPHAPLVESETAGAELSADKGYYHAEDTVNLHGSGFAAATTVTLSFYNESGATGRSLSVTADSDGAFDAEFVAEPNGTLGSYTVQATDGNVTASIGFDVVTSDDLSHDPPTGDILRTYRLALLTDPTYANYFGAANVTAAKVALINRVTQVYEYEMSIRLVLIANNDLLNLNTAAQMTGTNGPCGGAACYSASQASSCTSSTLTRNRQVIGLLVGASSFDIGHIGVGQNGGGVASLGVVGGSNKAQGCTGIPTPVGDFYAVDYVAHEMGHQFAGNHTFNGTQSNCSGGNRNAGTSVEPGSGSSVMAYAGICQTDNLQSHSDPYFSERSFDEIVTYTSSNRADIAEVQMGVLTAFNTNGQQFQIQYNGNNSPAIVRGTNFTTAGVKAAIEGISGWPSGQTVTVSALADTAFTITFSGTTDFPQVLQLVNCTGGCTGYINEIAKGGPVTNKGFTVTPTGNNPPVVTTAAGYTIPLRTPFALTGSATDPDGDPLTYMWEQNDRGASAGTGLVSNTKANGPLFRQFGTVALVSASDTLLYESPNENHVDGNPTRVFPDMAQIIANNTNAETGTCPTALPNPTSLADKECYSEFLPTAAYVGFTGVNASPARLNFRLTARDGKGGVNNAATVLTLATGAGPFLVTSPNTSLTWPGGTTQTVTWNPANTNVSPVSTDNVKISLSVDGGYTYPYVLAASTPNNGSAAVSIPNVATTQARVKVEAVGNVFFDISNADFTVTPTLNLVTTATLVKLGDGSYQATVSVKNLSAITAENVILASGSLGSASGSPTAISLGNIAAGATATTTMNFPASAGASGAAVVEKYNGTYYAGGVFTASIRAKLP